MSKETTIMLKGVRLAFVNIFRPQTDSETGRQSYGANLILETGSADYDENIAKIEKAMKIAARDKWGEKGDAMRTQLEKKDRLALHDGDTKAEYAGFEGNMFVSANNTSKPPAFDRVKDPDTGKPRRLEQSDDKIYAGAYVNAKVEIWSQDSKDYGKRINASLQGVQFVKDGERFGGGAVASEDDFDAEDAGDEDDLF